MNDIDNTTDADTCAGVFPDDDDDPDRCVLCEQPRSAHQGADADAAE